MGTAIVQVSVELFKLISPEPGSIIEVASNDIPSDAEFGGLVLRGDTFYVEVKSPSIPDVSFGAQLPMLRGPTFTRSDAPLLTTEHRATLGRMDINARLYKYRMMLAAGRVTINQCREIEGLPLIGAEGDQFFKSSAPFLLPTGDPAAEPLPIHDFLPKTDQG